MGPQAWNPARHLRPLKSCNWGLAAAAVATESGCVVWRDFRTAHGKTRRLPWECLHILRLPALPWRVIIDSETRSLYNKADNWLLFFFSFETNGKTILWNYFSPIQLSRPAERGMMIARSLRKEEKQTPKVQSLWRNKFQFHGKAGLHEGRIKESKLPSGPFLAFSSPQPCAPLAPDKPAFDQHQNWNHVFSSTSNPRPSLWKGTHWVSSVTASQRLSWNWALFQPLPQGFVFRFFSSN